MTNLTLEQEKLIKDVWNPEVYCLLSSRPVTQEKLDSIWIGDYGQSGIYSNPLAINPSNNQILTVHPNSDDIDVDYVVVGLSEIGIQVFGCITTLTLAGDKAATYYLGSASPKSSSFIYEHELDHIKLTEAINKTREIIQCISYV